MKLTFRYNNVTFTERKITEHAYCDLELISSIFYIQSISRRFFILPSSILSSIYYIFDIEQEYMFVAYFYLVQIYMTTMSYLMYYFEALVVPIFLIEIFFTDVRIKWILRKAVTAHNIYKFLFLSYETG